MSDLILSVTVLAAFALLGGAIYLWRKQGANRQALLMLVMAVVLIGNVLIWAAPLPQAPAGAEGASGGAGVDHDTAAPRD